MTTPTPADLLFVLVFAVAAPLVDARVFWPAHRRLYETDPGWSRSWLCAWTMASQWMLVAFGVALWMAGSRSFADLGLSLPAGGSLWAAVGLLLLVAAYQGWAMTVLARSAEQRDRLRPQLGALASVLPHTGTELRWFAGLSCTAGIAEEFLYRGYLIWVFTPWLGWWGAAALSLPFFAASHFYQGWSGVARSAVMGAAFTAIVAVFDSLWPAILLHALIDFGSGAMAWLVLRAPGETGTPGEMKGSDEDRAVARL